MTLLNSYLYFKNNMGSLFCGNSLDILKELPNESVHMCVTSPPYYMLRDYGSSAFLWPSVSYVPMVGISEVSISEIESVLGMEGSIEAYIGHLILIFREVKRVLRKDGTLWINIGDTYCGGRRGSKSSKQRSNVGTQTMPNSIVPMGLKNKDMMGIPWRLAFALQADGWWLRMDNIWHKTNSMPESVNDRTTRSHEYIFQLSKSNKYYFDHTSIKEPVSESTVGRGIVSFGGEKGRNYNPDKEDPNFRNGSEQWGKSFDYTKSCKYGVNKRSVWSIPNEPFKGTHYATFPKSLVLPTILAGTSSYGCCSKCGAPYYRVIEKTGHVNFREEAHVPGNSKTKTDSTGWKPTIIATDNWESSCSCESDVIPCTVLDPFMGSGRTAVACQNNFRHWVGIDISIKYCEIIKKEVNANIGIFGL